MTDETQAAPDEAAEIPSTLTHEQEQRVEALWQARAMITHESTSSTVFGSGETLASPVPGEYFAHHLIVVAEYIERGQDRYGDVVPARIESAELDYAYAEPARCACDVAREFTSGENTVTAAVIRTEDDRVILVHDGAEYFSRSYVQDHPDAFAQPAPEPGAGHIFDGVPGVFGDNEPDATFAAEVGDTHTPISDREG